MDQLTLGQFIDLLKRMPSEQGIRFDCVGAMPGRLDSYRGFYDQLALAWHRDYDKQPTVADVLKDAQESVGKIFEGYKGGLYQMGRDTPVWVSNYGECDNQAVTGVTDRGWIVTIDTAWQEW